MYQRELTPLRTRSFFLFGPRGVGKSTLLKTSFKKNDIKLWIDLLDEELNRRLLLHPKELEALCQNLKKGDWVVIDEVQKVPGLLNYVQRLIESKNLKFALTGSSARKLKRESANLLGGRAHAYNLFTLSHAELGSDFKLQAALEMGLLPTIWGDQEKESQKDYLRGYVNNYIRQEIKEEQVVRKLEPFLHFLEIAAQMNTEPINHTKIAHDAGVDNKAVERYYEILVDTWLGFFLPPYDRSVRKQQLQRSKFYFFDTGVCRALAQTLNVSLSPSTTEYGRAFENFIMIEIQKINAYLKKDFRLSYIRTKDDLEVDLVIKTPDQKILLIEIKSSSNVDTNRMGALVNLKKDIKADSLWVFSNDKTRRGYKDLTVWPWREGLAQLHKL